MKPSWKTLRGISYAFSLLSPRAKKIFILISLLNPLFTVLDLFSLGVLTLTIASVTIDSKQPRFTDFLFKLNEFFFHIDTDVEPMRLVLNLIFFSVALMLLKTLLIVIFQFVTARFLAAQHSKVSEQLTKSFFDQDIESINLFTSQEIGFTLNHGVYYTVNSTLSAAASAISELALLIGMLIVLYIFYPIATSYLLVFFILIFAVSHFFLSKRADARGGEASSGYILSLSAIQDAIRLHRELWLSNRHNFFQQRITQNVKSTANGYSQQVFLGQLPKVVFETALLIGLLFLATNALRDTSNKSLISLMVTLTVAGIRIAPSLIRLQGSVLTLQIMRPSVNRLMEFCSKIGKQAVVLPDEMASDFVPSITMSEVSYSFQDTRETLFEGASINIRPFDVVGISGVTGTGKSTLIDLLLGFRKPSKGHVTISGVPPSSAKIMWPQQISFLNQKISLIEGSIAQNIALGCPPELIDYKRISELVSRLNLNEIVSGNLENELNLKEDGLGISGGQRQRLAIARALYGSPKILVLDEASSAQDLDSELSIIDTINELRGACTIVIVAHSQNFLGLSDRLFKIENGKIIEIAKTDLQKFSS
jgi:ABC-type bacteriocin/lantibiotic exporter with double-glycine peptidase domain